MPQAYGCVYTKAIFTIIEMQFHSFNDYKKSVRQVDFEFYINFGAVHLKNLVTLIKLCLYVSTFLRPKLALSKRSLLHLRNFYRSPYFIFQDIVASSGWFVPILSLLISTLQPVQCMQPEALELIVQKITQLLKISLLYISTSIWVLHTPKAGRTPNAGRNSLFQHFCCKKP